MPPRSWDPTALLKKRETLRMRAPVMAAVRQFFADQGFIEVDTPALQVSPGLDRHVRPLETKVHQPFKDPPQALYLHTSPEFAMKKLLAGGETAIYQMGHVYRDGERSARHHPEFTLLEWYRAEATYDTMVSDVQALISHLCETLSIRDVRHKGMRCSVPVSWQRYTVAEMFARHAGVDVLATIDDPHAPSGKALAAEARRIGVTCPAEASWDDAFHAIFLDRVEPALAVAGGIILTEYPAPVGALAKRSTQDARVCERAEAFLCGLELANGYSELTDTVEQRARFERDRAAAASLYGSAPPIDEAFMTALAAMPPAAGMALGVDRLVMLLTGAENITDVLWETLPE